MAKFEIDIRPVKEGPGCGSTLLAIFIIFAVIWAIASGHTTH